MPPTGDELDKIANGMLGKPRCDYCNEECRNFSALVTHLKAQHPEQGDPRPQG